MEENNNNNDYQGDDTTEESVDIFTQFFGSAREMVERYTHCPLCGANLHFTHITDFSRNMTQETARCPECGVKTRRFVHKLQ